MDLGALLKGQRVLFTGASSGLGDHFAKLFAGCGAKVVIGARRKDKLDALAAELAQLGSPQVTAVQLDVSDADSVTCGFAEIAASGDALDVVNNAGISGHHRIAAALKATKHLTPGLRSRAPLRSTRLCPRRQAR